jgi:hypothetical protein
MSDKIELSATGFVGRALICESKELTRPDGTIDGTAPLGKALMLDSMELRTAGFVGRALMSEIKEFAKPDGRADARAPLGRALI